ncbi:TPA: hypothetical protein ACF2TC_003325, partial [Legionella pneumophila]
FYLLTNLVLVNKLSSSVIRTMKENEVIMIHLNQTNAPLELAFSLNDLLRALMLTSSSTRNQNISYSYWNRLSIKRSHRHLSGIKYPCSLPPAVQCTKAVGAFGLSGRAFSWGYS